jgi:hypothetical protein
MAGTFDAACGFASGIGAYGSGRGEIHEVFRDVHEPVVALGRTVAMISRFFFLGNNFAGAAPLDSEFVRYTLCR